MHISIEIQGFYPLYKEFLEHHRLLALLTSSVHLGILYTQVCASKLNHIQSIQLTQVDSNLILTTDNERQWDAPDHNLQRHSQRSQNECK